MPLSVDKLNPAHQSALKDAIGGLKHMFGNKAPESAAHQQANAAGILHGSEEQMLFDLKRDILAQVRASTATGERPTLEQYRLACEAFAQTDKGQGMAERGEWNAKIFADLSGQDLSGFTISEPRKQIGQAHHLDEQKPEETHGHHANIGKNYDGNDLDGDGQINVAAQHPFYDNIRFDKADLHGAFVEPATSFNEEIAKANNLKDMTFNGMSEGDVFTFRPGVHENAHMTNIDGGEIVFASHSQVNGVSIEGKAAKITIGDHASVDHIQVSDEFRIIKLEMGRDSVIANSDLRQSTVSMTSHFEPGAKFDNVQLSGNLSGLDFSGLKLHNVTIDGDPISSREQLADYGISFDARTSTTTTSSLMAQQVGIGGVGHTLLASQQSIGSPLTEQENQRLAEINAERAARAEQQAQVILPPLSGHKG